MCKRSDCPVDCTAKKYRVELYNPEESLVLGEVHKDFHVCAGSWQHVFKLVCLVFGFCQSKWGVARIFLEKQGFEPEELFNVWELDKAAAVLVRS